MVAMREDTDHPLRNAGKTDRLKVGDEQIPTDDANAPDLAGDSPRSHSA
jgi:hypothetical protein